jgi:AraC-like DNA-binding protein
MLFTAPFSRSYHLAPRRFHGAKVQAIGYLPEKTDGIDHLFTTFNYSLILSGAGFYEREGVPVPLAVPCVITQLPGIHARYGPAPRQTWEELYFIFQAESLEALTSKGLVGDEAWMWPIQNVEAVRRAARELKAVIDSSSSAPGDNDRLDLLVERVLMETLLPGWGAGDPGSQAVAHAVRTILASPDGRCHFAEIARDHGLSYSTFQRNWRRFYSETPGEYQLNARISKSCRLLAESPRRILEIAEVTGFDDPAYFSRLFHKRIGMSPSQYRRFHGTNPAIPAL